MSFPLSPAQRLLLTTPLDEEVLNALLAYQQWQNGTVDFLNVGEQNVTASQRLVLTSLIPPVNLKEEWTPYYVQVRDSNQVSLGDQVQFRLLDSVANAAVTWVASTGFTIVGVTQNHWHWPTTLNLNNIAQPFEMRLLRRENGEVWRVLDVFYAADATVGTRAVSTYFVYKRRRQ